MTPSPFDSKADRATVPLRFLEVIAPMIRRGRDRLRAEAERLRRYREAPYEVSTIEEALAVALRTQLAPMFERTMVLELHVARMKKQLMGDTAAKRFDSFIRRLGRPGTARAVLAEYPILAIQAELAISRWAAFGTEFLRHLCEDWQAIRSTFRPQGEPGPVVGVDFAGDRHRGGRGVLIVHFRSGWRLVYKPKSLAVEGHFQQLLAWLNERGARPFFQMMPVLDRGDHGWSAFVSTSDCPTEAEVRRFYQRQGAYLALLYGLMATDCHLENVIAAGEHPVLVDLEGLFHRGPEEAAGQVHADSVLGVRFLPQRFQRTDTGAFVDFSALGATAGQLSPAPVPCWEDSGTDEMRVVRRQAPLPGAGNRPTLHGAEVDLRDYHEDVIRGFKAMYQLLRTRRDELLADDGPLDAFAGDEVRFIARTTQSYALLIRQSYHPDLLRGGRAREQFFNRLWAGGEQSSWRDRLREAERSDLQRGDIPLFTTRPGSCDLWTSTGERIADFFPCTSLELVRRRLGRLGQMDLTKQLAIIREAFKEIKKINHG